MSNKKRGFLFITVTIAVLIVVALLLLAIIFSGNAKSNAEPFLSPKILDWDYTNTAGHDRYFYDGNLYSVRRGTAPLFSCNSTHNSEEKLIIKRRAKSETKNIAEVDGQYSENYIAVFDENHLILRRDLDEPGYAAYVVYNLQDKTEYVLTEAGSYYYFSEEHDIVCGSEWVYFSRCLNREEKESAGKEEYTPAYALFRYSPATGTEEEIHRYSGEYMSMTSEGFWQETNEGIIFFSFADLTTSFLGTIEWPERGLGMFQSEYFLCTTDYIVRSTHTGIDVYNMKTGEAKEIFKGDFLQMCAIITEKEVCFSQWEVDVAYWPLNAEADGTYKYTFETGTLEKITDEDCWFLCLLDERTLLVETTLGFWKKIKI